MTQSTSITFSVSTKTDEDSAAKTTSLTLVFDDAAVERSLARQQAVVKLQSAWRKKGIPPKTTVKLSDLRVGVIREVPSMEDQFAAMSPEERKQKLAELMARYNEAETK